MAHSTKTPAERARLVVRWRASGSSQAAFARRHGVHPRTFWGWSRDVARETARPAATFVPVQVLSDPGGGAPAGGLDIVLVHGERIHMEAGTSPTWVTAILAGLRATC